METENQQVRKDLKRKLVTGVVVKFVLVAFSFVQAHLGPIACATGTVAAAAMFGDKVYWINIGKETKKIADENPPEETVKFIEAELAKYPKWRQEEPNGTPYAEQKIKDLYFYLAKAKEAAGLDKNEIIDAYKHAAASLSYGGNAFMWLYKNIPDTQRRDVFRQVFQSVSEDKQNFQAMVRYLEKKDDWNVFEFFLGLVFDQSPELVSAAKSIEASLNKDGKWVDKFITYCRGKPKTVEFVYERDCNEAEGLVKQEEFKKAAAVYKVIAERYKKSADKKTEVEFKICRCLFNAGDYSAAISEINKFVEQNKATNRKLTKDAFFLKGQCYIQLGEIDKATNEFLTLMIEYPETKESAEASFFAGYCYMLQGKFDLAKETLNMVVKDYSQSSFAGKAKLCLTRIENMAK